MATFLARLVECALSRPDPCAGRELAFQRSQALQDPATTLDAALLSRLLLCHYASLVSSLDKSPRDSSVSSQAAAQALQLHTILRLISTLTLVIDHLSTSVHRVRVTTLTKASIAHQTGGAKEIWR